MWNAFGIERVSQNSGKMTISIVLYLTLQPVKVTILNRFYTIGLKLLWC